MGDKKTNKNIACLLINALIKSNVWLQSTKEPERDLLLGVRMTRPRFPVLFVAVSVIRNWLTRYQMKGLDIISHMTPHCNGFGLQIFPKLAIFLKN